MIEILSILFGITIQMIQFKWKEPIVPLIRLSKKEAFGAIIRRTPKKENSKHGTKMGNLRESLIIRMDYDTGFMNIGIQMDKESQSKIIQTDKNMGNVHGGTRMEHYKINWFSIGG